MIYQLLSVGWTAEDVQSDVREETSGRSIKKRHQEDTLGRHWKETLGTDIGTRHREYQGLLYVYEASGQLLTRLSACVVWAVKYHSRLGEMFTLKFDHQVARNRELLLFKIHLGTDSFHTRHQNIMHANSVTLTHFITQSAMISIFCFAQPPGDKLVCIIRLYDRHIKKDLMYSGIK